MGQSGKPHDAREPRAASANEAGQRGVTCLGCRRSRAILDHLTAKELRAAVDGHELHVDDRRVKAQLVDALAGSRKVRLAEVLPELSRNRLKELCRVFGLDDSGRKKADIVARLVGAGAESKSDGPRAKPAAARSATPGPAAGAASPKAGTQGATTGHEAELWRMADALRGSMDAAEYKHVVLGLVFLKYISAGEVRAPVAAPVGLLDAPRTELPAFDPPRDAPRGNVHPLDVPVPVVDHGRARAGRRAGRKPACRILDPCPCRSAYATTTRKPEGHRALRDSEHPGDLAL